MDSTNSLPRDITRTLALFGASGGTGSRLAQGAHRQGWKVRAMGRAASPPADLATVLAWKHGEFSDARVLAETITGTDAVACTFGPRWPDPGLFCAEAMRAIAGAMRAAGEKRLVCVTGAMIGDYPANRTMCFRLFRALLARRFGAMFADRRMQEEIVRASELDWTLFKPPRLTDDEPAGRVCIGPDVRVGMLSKISRLDLAAALLGELTQPRHHRKAVFVVSG